MKKFWKSLMFALVGVFALSSCEDVPAPYPIPNAEGGEKPATSTFYSSVSLSDWEMLAAESGNNPWSQGSSYTQATGYQKWDGADTKSNRMADGYIISPAFSTTTDSTTAYVSFQYCVAYANNDPQFADHIKMYVTSQYEAGEGFVADKWTELDWKATHVSTNWELETTAVALPAEFLNQEKVNVAFYFTTPNGDKSSTFELKDLKVVAGTPSENGGDEGPEVKTSGDGTLENPYTVADALAVINAKANTSNKVYVKGIISAIGVEKNGQMTDLPGNQYKNATYFISDDGNTDSQLEVFRGKGLGGEDITTADYIKVGDNVVVYGELTLFYETPEIATGSEIAELNGKKADDNPTPTPQPSGDNILANGDFESWTGGLPNHWKSASSASSASLSQSSDAHSGSYAVAIAGDASANKRMAYEEITLKAGTYTFSFYAKATTADASQCRIGYTTVVDGKANTNYSYGDYTSLNNSTWSQASYTFTLSAETTLCLVVMNPKTSNYATAQTIIVDDATLVTSDGGLVDGGNDNPDTPGTPDVDVQHITIAEFLNKADTSTAYELTGTVANIKNTQYGNFDLVEGDASIYIYGLLDLEGQKKNFGSLGISEGDKITITGVYKLYNGKPEIENAQFVRKEE